MGIWNVSIYVFTATGEVGHFRSPGLGLFFYNSGGLDSHEDHLGDATLAF